MLAVDLPRPYVYPAVLLTAFAVIFVALGIAPWYREDWLLENLLVFIAIPLLVFGIRRLRLSNLSYTLLFLFFVLHEIGAHFTYSLVPYDAWFQALSGHALNGLLGWERNHYDRVIHFAYGFMILPAVVELLEHVASPRGIWRFILPVTFIFSHSVIYELVEMGAAWRFGGDLGTAYLGTQGDEWDAQKDMSLAALGAVLGMVLISFIRPRPVRSAQLRTAPEAPAR
jgi:putative membrane protein